MASPGELELAGIIPAVVDAVEASGSQARLRLHVNGRLVEPGGRVPAAQLAAAPRVDLEADGVFTLAVCDLDAPNPERLLWLTTNVPDWEFALGHQARTAALLLPPPPPLAPPPPHTHTHAPPRSSPGPRPRW